MVAVLVRWRGLSGDFVSVPPTNAGASDCKILQNISKSYDWILMQFPGKVNNGRNNDSWLDFSDILHRIAIGIQKFQGSRINTNMMIKGSEGIWLLIFQGLRPSSSFFLSAGRDRDVTCSAEICALWVLFWLICLYTEVLKINCNVYQSVIVSKVNT